MNRTMTLGLSLLIGAVCVHAQPPYQDKKAGNAAEVTPGPALLEGCLQRSRGEYTITDRDNTLHHLSGGAKLLKSYIDHEVELTGTPSTRTIDTTLAGGASSAVVQPIFRVKTVKDVAATCR